MMKISKGTLFIRLGLLLIAAALLLTLGNIWLDRRAGRASENALLELNRLVELGKANSLDNKTADDTPLYVKYPDMDMPIMTVDGDTYIGILNVDCLGLILPVKSDFSYANLNKAVCRYDGSVYKDNMIIAGHNFSRHFGRLKDAVTGSRVTFTDGDGNIFEYKISEITQVNGADVEEMKSGDWDMTLFTCTLSGKSRVAVRLVRTN